MPAFAVSAVDTTANTLTSTGVAAAGGAEGSVLQTGDRLRLRNTGGALPAATPSLAPVTDYYAIRVDDNTIKISDTNAHALAGTNIIDLTGSGSGTTTIEFGLPYCLPTAIAAQGVQARSSIFNAMYNALVALYAVLTGQAQAIWSAASLDATFASHGDRTDAVLGVDFKSTSGTNVTYVASIGRILTGAAVTVVARLPLKTGDRIKSVTALLGGDGSVDVTSFDVRLVTVSGTSSSIGSTTVNNITSGDTTINVTDTTLGVGESICVSITCNAALFVVDNCRYTYDHPWSP